MFQTLNAYCENDVKIIYNNQWNFNFVYIIDVLKCWQILYLDLCAYA